jgi:mono/diheme cytochrome c family protein
MAMAAALALGAALFGDLTYSHDVKPILDGNCVECHTQGGKDPDLSQFPFRSTKLGDLSAIVAKILEMTQPQGGAPAKMPPGSRAKLDSGQIDTITAWRDQGMNP